MKKLFLTAGLLLFSLFNAQVAIGKSNISSPSVSLEFGNVSGGDQKGMLLPWVTASANVAGAVPGTLIYDLADKKVKYFKYDESKTSNIWFDLSVDTTGTADDSLQAPLEEKAGAKVTIGTPTATPGILVLEDTNKAMVLPLVDKYTSVLNPSPGMMVYDLANNMLCLFNGNVWSFWKP